MLPGNVGKSYTTLPNGLTKTLPSFGVFTEVTIPNA